MSINIKRCPKCSSAVTIRYCRGGSGCARYAPAHGDAHEPRWVVPPRTSKKHEHLDVTCLVCGYRTTLPTHDDARVTRIDTGTRYEGGRDLTTQLRSHRQESRQPVPARF